MSRLAFAFGAPALVMASVLGVAWLSTTRFDTVMGPSRPTLFTPPSEVSPTAELDSAAPPPAPPPNADEAVPTWQAQARNALIPYSRAPLLSPAKFSAASDNEAPARALQCLTSAVYYEATGEPDAGKRAVAQIVVNRWANRAFPKTICGVVEQGASAPGCQFSFMCDGSMGRRPSAKAWADAEAVAQAALNGYIETSVGAATHYHADYVVPVWASTMLKLVKLGRHIFYRWPGAAAYMGAPTLVAAEPSTPAGAPSLGALGGLSRSDATVATPPPSALPEVSDRTIGHDGFAGSVAAPKPQTAPVVASPSLGGNFGAGLGASLAPLASPKPAPEPPRRPVPPPSLRVGPV